jgi:hypothetical protein
MPGRVGAAFRPLLAGRSADFVVRIFMPLGWLYRCLDAGYKIIRYTNLKFALNQGKHSFPGNQRGGSDRRQQQLLAP